MTVQRRSMETARTWNEQDLRRLDEIIVEGERRFKERQPRSGALIDGARKVLAGGATSSWQIARPQMIWVSHGEGSKIFDADGGEYVDLHGGYGVGAVGHGHPKIVEAITRRAPRGTHFAQPTEDAIAVAGELARRFGLPVWRFANSGTEATMDAVHLMRAITGRDRIVKFEGAYHGHHDSVQVSVQPEGDLGPARRPRPVPASSGIPRAMTDLCLVAPYNDLASLEQLFEAHRGEIAGVIVEPIMMGCGILYPDPGYLEGMRALTRRHGALLTFDEVKTGLTVHPGGATALTGVTPDIVCLAKALGGGLPIAAVGGTAAVMEHVARGRYEQVGTFNGNPLALAAARAMLHEVLTPDAYARVGRLQTRLAAESARVLDRYGIAARVLVAGAKG